MVKIMNINFLFHLEIKLIFSQESNLKTWKMRENWECENIENAILQLAGSTKAKTVLVHPTCEINFGTSSNFLILVFSLLLHIYLLLFQLCDSNSWRSFSVFLGLKGNSESYDFSLSPLREWQNGKSDSLYVD